MKKQNLAPHNDKHQRHGYWIWYFNNGNLMVRGNYINGQGSGYWETYCHINAIIDTKRYYIP